MTTCESEIDKINKILGLITKEGLITLIAEDIKKYLQYAKKLTIQSVIIPAPTKEEIEKSGILSEELKKSHKYIINITSGANITLFNIDNIVGVFADFHNKEHTFSVAFEEGQDKFQIDTYLIEL